MSHTLIPRLTTGDALARFTLVESALRSGRNAADLVIDEAGVAVPHPTGGSAPTASVLGRWRAEVMESLRDVKTGSVNDNAMHSMRLGQAISEVIDPSPSDAAHDGGWAFLSLNLFPDILEARWPLKDGRLPKDRWIGKQAGRDRNYLKLAWRRWQLLGPVMVEFNEPFGEDEFGSLLERQAVARNVRLVRFAAREVATYQGAFGRNDFTRALMMGLTAMTGPLQLDVLDDHELEALVRATAMQIDPHSSGLGA
ncbi:hypothetical protein [Kribbia dieselivorans]|uniref:hypothetical protein n=1 Tax=Kribbia dieselivorans TaxID=331526 RepID=UPI000838900C|nr:hypothetical protein [Kribbia dieselivorans]